MPIASSPMSARRVSALTLIAVNIGVATYALIRQFGYAELLLLYWAETVVIGLLNVPKLLIASLFTQRIYTIDELSSAGKRTLTILFLLLVYSIVFGIVWMLLYVGIIVLPALLEQADHAADMVESSRRALDQPLRLDLAVAALALSHGVSFVANFLLGREFRGASLFRIAVQPILRTVWVVGVIGLAAVVALVQPAVAKSTAFAVVVVAAKIAADLFSHLRERKRFQETPSIVGTW